MDGYPVAQKGRRRDQSHAIAEFDAAKLQISQPIENLWRDFQAQAVENPTPRGLVRSSASPPSIGAAGISAANSASRVGGAAIVIRVRRSSSTCHSAHSRSPKCLSAQPATAWFGAINLA